MDPNITNPIYDDPTKVTCKVVKRKGQKGARIYPKGCKVRTEVDRAGNITNRYTDTGLNIDCENTFIGLSYENIKFQ